MVMKEWDCSVFRLLAVILAVILAVTVLGNAIVKQIFHINSSDVLQAGIFVKNTTEISDFCTVLYCTDGLCTVLY